jgi:hypothetical protein
MANLLEYLDWEQTELQDCITVLRAELFICQHEAQRAKDLKRPKLMLDYLVRVEKLRAELRLVQRAFDLGQGNA